MTCSSKPTHLEPTSPPSGLLPWLFRDEVHVLETRALWLRWPRAEDGAALQAIAGRKSVAEMTASWPHPLPAGEAGRRIAGARAGNAEGRTLQLALASKSEPGRLIGMVGANVRPDGDLGLGYMLDPALHGQGLMSEAVAGLVRELFIHTRFERILASSRVINPASRRVLEKAGFAHVGTGPFVAAARGGAIAVDDFAIDRALWLARPETRLLRAALVAMRSPARRAGAHGRRGPDIEVLP